jgi:hypothetical protein
MNSIEMQLHWAASPKSINDTEYSEQFFPKWLPALMFQQHQWPLNYPTKVGFVLQHIFSESPTLFGFVLSSFRQRDIHES